jgi:centromere protein I
VSIKPTVDVLVSSLYDTGALPDELTELVNLITRPNHLDQAARGALVRNLYPTNKVPKEVLLNVLGCLGHGELKPSLAIQALMLRWLVMAYNVLEDPGLLSQAYAVLFNLLDTAALRYVFENVAALLLFTDHVGPNCVTCWPWLLAASMYGHSGYKLCEFIESDLAVLFALGVLIRGYLRLSLSRQTGSDPALTGLLRVFKNYYPEIIVGEVTKGRASTFKVRAHREFETSQAGSNKIAAPRPFVAVKTR